LELGGQFHADLPQVGTISKAIVSEVQRKKGSVVLFILTT